MFYGTLFTLPAATSTLANVGAYSSSLFSDLLPLAELILGFALPALIVGALIVFIIRAFRHRD
jgi:hypothetical protein